MNEERRQILQMLADGRITADEAERLIDALEREQSQAPRSAAPGAKPPPKYLRVVVEDDGSHGDPASRVNIRVPLQLLRAGVRLASLVPPQMLGQINVHLGLAGVPIDLTQLKPQHIEELVEHLDDLTVDVDDSGAKVKVFCE